jgi:glycosyltransferase involved in cell wall biosynthesis
MQWYCNRIYRKAKAIVYQNAHEKSCFDAELADKGYIIPNPVKVSARREADAGKIVVTAGRLVEQKNQAMLLRAMARLRERDPQVKCRIYGDGAMRDELEQQIHEQGLQNTVSLEGNVSDIHERLAQCAIFVLTSNFEGLSNALIEAMMVGLPCITTDYPGARELIMHEQNGIVVPMDDDEALAFQMEKLLCDQKYAARLAQQGRSDSERFKAETVLQQWRELIEE